MLNFGLNSCKKAKLFDVQLFFLSKISLHSGTSKVKAIAFEWSGGPFGLFFEDFTGEFSRDVLGDVFRDFEEFSEIFRMLYYWALESISKAVSTQQVWSIYDIWAFHSIFRFGLRSYENTKILRNHVWLLFLLSKARWAGQKFKTETNLKKSMQLKWPRYKKTKLRKWNKPNNCFILGA